MVMAAAIGHARGALRARQGAHLTEDLEGQALALQFERPELCQSLLPVALGLRKKIFEGYRGPRCLQYIRWPLTRAARCGAREAIPVAGRRAMKLSIHPLAQSLRGSSAE